MGSLKLCACLGTQYLPWFGGLIRAKVWPKPPNYLFLAQRDDSARSTWWRTYFFCARFSWISRTKRVHGVWPDSLQECELDSGPRETNSIYGGDIFFHNYLMAGPIFLNLTWEIRTGRNTRYTSLVSDLSPSTHVTYSVFLRAWETLWCWWSKIPFFLVSIFRISTLDRLLS